MFDAISHAFSNQTFASISHRNEFSSAQKMYTIREDHHLLLNKKNLQVYRAIAENGNEIGFTLEIGVLFGLWSPGQTMPSWLSIVCHLKFNFDPLDPVIVK